jgi:ribonucleoside-diphosphate reductase beta chain
MMNSLTAGLIISDDSDEPILSRDLRLTTYPIEHNDIWQCYKRQQASFWVAEEIDFSRDREQFYSLSDAERHFIKNILVFFAASDTLVSMNLMNNFCSEVAVLEAHYAYTFQAQMENVHAEVYSQMIETFIQDNHEKDSIYMSLAGMSSVIRKVDWARKWSSPSASVGGHGNISSKVPFRYRLVAFAIVEGLFFSGAFCAIYWLKQRNLLPGLTKSNEFIARDEGQHTEFACLMYSKLVKKMTEVEVHAMFSEAVTIEKEFIVDSISCRLVGMNSDLMCQYIEYVADNLLRLLGYSTIYGSTNPFGFMDLISMGARSNFFEERVSLYQRSDVLNVDNEKGESIYSEDF